MESLAARVVLAGEGRLLCMCLVVLMQYLVDMEGQTARLVLADKRPFTWMSALMPFQGSKVMKSFAARPVVASVRALI